MFNIKPIDESSNVSDQSEGLNVIEAPLINLQF